MLLSTAKKLQTPFPLALHRVESVLAVKGTLCRFAPLTAPVRKTRCLRGAYQPVSLYLI